MKSEYDALMRNGTWELVDKPQNSKILTNRWVFKVKRNQDGTVNKLKARLVARGNEQRKGIDFEEVYAPVARYEIIRTLFAGAVENRMHVHHMDVVAAYVQGELADTLYMRQPEMFEQPSEEDKVCKLKKPIYGLKQAGREWYRTLDKYLKKIGLTNSQINPCVYLDNTRRTDLIIIIYVDDLILASRDLQELTRIKGLLKRKFEINDLGKATNILGISIQREGDTGPIKMSQRKYVEDILKKFGMEDCKTTSTPLEPYEVFSQENTETEFNTKVPYRELVGALVYLSNATRPDIAFAANILSQFNENPSNYHWKAAKHVLRYLKYTINYGISYSITGKQLELYADADWAGDESTRRSRSAYVSLLAGGPISWETKKQKSVALSTMEAEYVALSEATKEAMYLKRLLTHMGFGDFVSGKTTIYCDNQSAIHMSKNNMYHRRSKHIDIRYHYSREMRERGEIDVQHTSTNEMKADILTKSLPKIKLRMCVDLLNLNNQK